MSSRTNLLAKNTAIFGLGNFGSKFLQIILIPYYTRVLTEAEFGTTDILHSVISLLFPIISLSVYEAVFRYAMECDLDKTAVFSSGFGITLIGSLIFVLIGFSISFFFEINYLPIIIISTILHAFRSLYSQYARATNRTTLYSLDDLLFTAFVLIFNILFISVFRLGVMGYMIGHTLANAVSCIILQIALKIKKLNFLKTRGYIKLLLKFSSPLIFNTICWWTAAFASRFFIVFYIGTAANGIFSAANKIPSLLTTLVSVFFGAWQISANAEFKNADAKDFYTQIYNLLFSIITTVSSVLILLCKPITNIFLGENFKDAAEIMPTLLIAMSFFAFSQFLGSIYTANKKTGMALFTNIICVAVCLLLNFILIKPFGILGCAISSLVSYFVLWVVRIFNTKKILPMKYNFTKTTLSISILLLQDILISFNIKFGTFISFIGLLCILYIFKNQFIKFINFVRSYLWKTSFRKKRLQ